MYFLLLGRKYLKVIKRALEYFVVAAIVRYFSYFEVWSTEVFLNLFKHCSYLICRSAPHSLKLMLAGVLAGNRKLYMIYFPLFLNHTILLHSIKVLVFIDSYAYIYTSNGVSLHELAISLSKGRKYSARDNDNLCIICADGGNLLLCDGCPRAFHKGEL